MSWKPASAAQQEPVSINKQTNERKQARHGSTHSPRRQSLSCSGHIINIYKTYINIMDKYNYCLYLKTNLFFFKLRYSLWQKENTQSLTPQYSGVFCASWSWNLQKLLSPRHAGFPPYPPKIFIWPTNHPFLKTGAWGCSSVDGKLVQHARGPGFNPQHPIYNSGDGARLPIAFRR